MQSIDWGNVSMAKTLLIVEDDEGVREALAEVLADELHASVIKAGGYKEVRALLTGEHVVVPDLILTDVNLGDGNGLTFIIDLAAGEFGDRLRQAPVIIFSGEITEDVLQARKALPNFAGFIEKPVDPSRVRELIEESLNPVSLKLSAG